MKKLLLALTMCGFLTGTVVGCGGGRKPEPKKPAPPATKEEAPKTEAPKTEAPKEEAPK
ncbi:MAG: hypothetical protein N3A38_01865 [Planctomycetota bacterium]|nr:hypothetical protein [Planctomycetota bacterium]